MTDAWREAGTEPRLNDLLNDPLVQAVMRRDGIGRAEVTAAIRSARQGLASRQDEWVKGLRQERSSQQISPQVAYCGIRKVESGAVESCCYAAF